MREKSRDQRSFLSVLCYCFFSCYLFYISAFGFVFPFWVLCFCFESCQSVFGFVILFWVLWFCIGFCDSVLSQLSFCFEFCASVLGIVILFLGFVILFRLQNSLFFFSKSVRKSVKRGVRVLHTRSARAAHALLVSYFDYRFVSTSSRNLNKTSANQILS